MPITEADIQRIHQFERKVLPKYPYWYGMKRILFEYLDLPKWLPINAHLQHGAASIYRNGKPDRLVLNNRYPVILLSNKTQQKVCKEHISNKPIEVVGSLFPYYRRMRNIEQSPQAKGTIVFPVHSSKFTELKLDWKGYAEMLKALPAEFQPITVCVYWIDVQHGVHKHFEEAGLNVVTTGHIGDPKFVERFYDFLKDHRYACSNEVGSYLYYSVEMDIPFFMIGESPVFVNVGEGDMPEEEFNLSAANGYANLLRAGDLFKFSRLEDVRITDQQRDFVEFSTGKHDAISKEELRALLKKYMPRYLLQELIYLPQTLGGRTYRFFRNQFRKK